MTLIVAVGSFILADELSLGDWSSQAVHAAILSLSADDY